MASFRTDRVPPLSLRKCTTALKEAKREVAKIVSSNFTTRELERKQRIEELATSGKRGDKEHATRLHR